VLKDHGQGNIKKGGGTVMLCGTGARARSLEQDLGE